MKQRKSRARVLFIANILRKGIQMDRMSIIFINILIIFIVWGCRAPSTDLQRADWHSTYNVQRATPYDISREGTIVFVRPKEMSLIGTKSLRDYIEVTYETTRRNDAGFLEVMIGLRNIGGLHWYDDRSPNFVLSVKTVFYDKPFNSSGLSIPPIYESNWESIKMIRGTTTQYKAICPLKNGTYYQIIISEILK